MFNIFFVLLYNSVFNVIWSRQIQYKHRYPRETSDNVLSSQETLGSQSLNPVVEDSDKAGVCMISSENEVKGE